MYDSACRAGIFERFSAARKAASYSFFLDESQRVDRLGQHHIARVVFQKSAGRQRPATSPASKAATARR